MKPTRARTPVRLKGAILALSFTAMATQAGSAPHALRLAGAPPAAHVSAASAAVPGERELLAWLARVMVRPPVPGSWALLVAGLASAWAIARRRMSAGGSRSLDPHRLRRR
ncbi:MAG TPA: hypothetical protein VGR86_03280 [Steroidobacteraceae bacterium]|nr:hypothetical protein [Steroidobacteraceae bacterium]